LFTTISLGAKWRSRHLAVDIRTTHRRRVERPKQEFPVAANYGPSVTRDPAVAPQLVAGLADADMEAGRVSESGQHVKQRERFTQTGSRKHPLAKQRYTTHATGDPHHLVHARVRHRAQRGCPSRTPQQRVQALPTE
jgi:hypothetical protein